MNNDKRASFFRTTRFGKGEKGKGTYYPPRLTPSKSSVIRRKTWLPNRSRGTTKQSASMRSRRAHTSLRFCVIGPMNAAAFAFYPALMFVPGACCVFLGGEAGSHLSRRRGGARAHARARGRRPNTRDCLSAVLSLARSLIELCPCIIGFRGP